eukprot:2667925-Rhodomonas_salina.1
MGGLVSCPTSLRTYYTVFGPDIGYGARSTRWSAAVKRCTLTCGRYRPTHALYAMHGTHSASRCATSSTDVDYRPVSSLRDFRC